MKIIYLDKEEKVITGGHKYNKAFIDYLTSYARLEVLYTPSCSKIYAGWKKIFGPIMELKRIKNISNGDIVFWGDTTLKYHFLLALITSLLKSPRSFIIIHHLPDYDNSFCGRINKFFNYRYVSLCGDIIVPSPYTLARTKKEFPQKTINYIPLPFEHKYTPSLLYIPGRYLYVGTVEERKGIHLLIESLAFVRQRKPEFMFKLDVVGKIKDEEYYNTIKNRIHILGLDNYIFFHGRVSDEALESFYREAEIFTFPSLLEGYGIVLVEAFNHGIPIISFNNSAMPYTIKDGINGFLAEDKNTVDFAEKILLLTGNVELRKKLQEGVKDTVFGLKTQDDFEKGIRELCVAFCD